MISVVIPLFNKESYISDTLQSVLAQTFSNLEVIVVDDGSTDGSATMVRAINDPRVQLLEIENSGVSMARNTGITTAKYNWIAFLDADDRWAPTFLEEMVQAIEDYPNEKIFATGRSMVFTNIEERYANTIIPAQGTTGLISYFEVITKDLPPVNSSNVLILKQLFQKRGFFREGMRQHEDHDLWIRLCAKHKVVFINKNLSFYKKDIANSASQSVYIAKDFIRYMQTMVEVLPLLSKKDTGFFLKYARKFIILSFLINSSSYTGKERKQLLKQAKKIIPISGRMLLKVASVLSFANLYGAYKKMKEG
ncbi:glycosyltransferase family 2 protein [Marinirhabdus gelatinilytica]|uniref:Glycosyltransferase involved in cell wall biosynthesis n=1 Tax=Marinirhabdus gelatinilytica TaxID=1703343 RepID=A0A370QGB3_9FLAO|nr:glycosyltransferase family 2 protein [Marinirhabdus gelatinilytica]RDK87329.1 glycosyltransferase involved in cell wall biosynthesis [Marinirhabdus gelatinilytica]